MQGIKESIGARWSSFAADPFQSTINLAYFTLLSIIATTGALFFLGIGVRLLGNAWHFFASSLA